MRYEYRVLARWGHLYPDLQLSGQQIYTDIEERLKARAIVKEMIDDFNGILLKMQAKYPLHFLHVDLRGMFTETDWLNEIHLKKSGFKRVAERFIDAIDNRLPAVLQARKDAGL